MDTAMLGGTVTQRSSWANALRCRFLGEVGLMDSRRVTVPMFEGTPEAGWMFATAAQGQGVAREACEAMLAWADAHGIARTVCMIAPGNAPSLRLAGRLGYERWAEGVYDERLTVMLDRQSSPGRGGGSAQR